MVDIPSGDTVARQWPTRLVDLLTEPATKNGTSAVHHRGGGSEVIGLRQVCRRFGESAAVEDLSLSIAAGEFFPCLAPPVAARPPPCA